MGGVGTPISPFSPGLVGAAVTFRYEHWDNGVLATPTSIKFSSRDTTYGARNKLTGEVLIADNTTFAAESTGIYTLTKSVPAANAIYEYSLEVTFASHTIFITGESTSFVTGGAENIYNLFGIRKKLVDLTGHFDLVTDAHEGDYSDRGANYFINAGQRWLERTMPRVNNPAWLIQSLAANANQITFNNARLIREVWLKSSEDVRIPIDQVSYWEMRRREYNATYTPTEVNCYASVPIGVNQWQWGEDLGSDYSWLQQSQYWPTRSILLWPAPAEAVTVEVLAEWRSVDFVNDSDITSWSVEHPDMLIKAARMCMEEELHRNETGKAAFERTLIGEVQKVYHGLVAEQSSGPAKNYVMRG